MRLFVETRSSSRLRDYRFLGTSPDEMWWGGYRRLTELEQPSLILAGDDHGGWRLLASAIPSKRVDSEGSTIRLTLAVDGDNRVDTDSALQVIRSWLHDLGGGTAQGELGALLDEVFTDEFVDAAYEMPPPDEGYPAKVRERLERVVTHLPPHERAAEPPDGSWYGGIESPEARDAFAASCREILNGRPGLACVLNSAGPEELSQLPESSSLAALLLEGPDDPEPIPPSPLLVATEEASPPGKARGRGMMSVEQTLARWSPRAKGPSATAGLLIAAALLIWILLLWGPDPAGGSCSGSRSATVRSQSLS